MPDGLGVSRRSTASPSTGLGRPFDIKGPGDLVAWSRILDDEEALCVLYAHGLEARGADVLVDASLNPPGGFMTVITNSAQAADRRESRDRMR